MVESITESCQNFHRLQDLFCQFAVTNNTERVFSKAGYLFTNRRIMLSMRSLKLCLLANY